MALEADTIRLQNLHSRPDYGFFLYFRPNYVVSDCIETSLYARETMYCAAKLRFLSGQNIVLVTDLFGVFFRRLEKAEASGS
jgi:hypothetical protein